MASDDEAFKNFIVTSDNESSAKENVAVKQPKTNQRQYDLIETFTQGIDERLMTKETYDQKWDDLAKELNRIGPPERDSWEWRRVWSTYKYNRKRKHSTESSSKRQLNQVPPLRDRVSEFQVSAETSSVIGQHTLSVQVLDKLDAVLGILTESNELLKKLVASMSTK